MESNPVAIRSATIATSQFVPGIWMIVLGVRKGSKARLLDQRNTLYCDCTCPAQAFSPTSFDTGHLHTLNSQGGPLLRRVGIDMTPDKGVLIPRILEPRRGVKLKYGHIHLLSVFTMMLALRLASHWLSPIYPTPNHSLPPISSRIMLSLKKVRSGASRARSRCVWSTLT